MFVFDFLTLTTYCTVFVSLADVLNLTLPSQGEYSN